MALYTTKNQTKILQKFQKKPKKKKKKKTPINKSKVMSLFYILTGPTLSLLVTLTDSFSSNSKPSLYILGLARPHLLTIFVLFSAAFEVQSMSHSIKHHAGRILNISALAFCQDLVTMSAASLLDHANSEELTVLACCAPCLVTPNQQQCTSTNLYLYTLQLVQMSLHISQCFCEVFMHLL